MDPNKIKKEKFERNFSKLKKSIKKMKNDGNLFDTYSIL
jgi:hypothetical protein